MKICVLNGSPRGRYSTTVHTLQYLEKRYPAHSFTYVNVGARIGNLEKNMTEVLDTMHSSDLILFSYPVYTFLAPSQLHRFIRKLKESGHSFAGKYVTQVTTSKHFYDMTAHRYVEENCQDLGMRVIHGLSADMEDLTTESGRQDCEKFFEYVLWCVGNGICESADKRPDPQPDNYTVRLEACEKRPGKDVVIVADLPEDDEVLLAKIRDFQAVCPYPTRIVNIREYPFKGGCLGCFHCVGDGKCIYKDGFDSFLRENIQSADAIVLAFRVIDHSMGPRFKTYDDRQFCNGHRTVTEGTPFAYLVAGNLQGEENLKTVMTARSEVGHNFLAGIATDAESIRAAAQRLSYALENHYLQPRNFWGVGGMKIFRDLIWMMRGLMKADHEFYKAHGAYDFPQKQRGKMLAMCLLGAMVRNPKIRAGMGNKFNEGMVAPYEKVVAEAKPKFQ